MSFINSSLTPKSMSFVTTPERVVNENGNSIVPEKESPYDLSANSYSNKRRKSFGLSLDSLQVQQCVSPVARPRGCAGLKASTIKTVNPMQSIGTGSQLTNSGKEFPNFGPIRSSYLVNHSDTSCVPIILDMDKRLHICCSSCKTPLGLPANNLLVTCSLTSSSKLYLRSLWKDEVQTSDLSTSSVPVLITDSVSVDPRLSEKSNEAAPRGSGQGIWCTEDGCVFNRVFCPSCSSSNCLGVQVMATDALNMSLQNKVSFFNHLSYS